ncbi:hypothetical protein C8R47DRAFT_1083957 [Mycena vitilis]|nr:hypothetical protein C8R47DRAFT_1083957 [Mycena vitilis]
MCDNGSTARRKDRGGLGMKPKIQPRQGPCLDRGTTFPFGSTARRHRCLRPAAIFLPGTKGQHSVYEQCTDTQFNPESEDRKNRARRFGAVARRFRSTLDAQKDPAVQDAEQESAWSYYDPGHQPPFKDIGYARRIAREADPGGCPNGNQPTPCHKKEEKQTYGGKPACGRILAPKSAEWRLVGPRDGMAGLWRHAGHSRGRLAGHDYDEGWVTSRRDQVVISDGKGDCRPALFRGLIRITVGSCQDLVQCSTTIPSNDSVLSDVGNFNWPTEVENTFFWAEGGTIEDWDLRS